VSCGFFDDRLDVTPWVVFPGGFDVDALFAAVEQAHRSGVDDLFVPRGRRAPWAIALHRLCDTDSRRGADHLHQLLPADRFLLEEQLDHRIE
jgi:hypothetical protein